MNIIDTNGVSYILNNNINPDENFYMPPDVAEEVESTQIIFGRKAPRQIMEIKNIHHLFNEKIYLERYKMILNKYGGRSFYNMTGFGDISIIASLYSLMYIYELQRKSQLFDTSEEVVVYTNDRGLKNKIIAEFLGENIRVEDIGSIK